MTCMSETPPTETPKEKRQSLPEKSAARFDREAAALRENLRKRKAQKAAQPGSPSSAATGPGKEP